MIPCSIAVLSCELALVANAVPPGEKSNASIQLEWASMTWLRNSPVAPCQAMRSPLLGEFKAGFRSGFGRGFGRGFRFSKMKSALWIWD
ncbi:hypothetical protein CY34DRAFT_807553 [Suillus luteus UH-Slu-Lm8-n1]|uniref:Secreted protein n=1 Tax=Suillus luteus UH-Slu-Lm8-n1 TaxID=930992 RepID=A0A0D0APY7_9AGAM|nr:hypothetical protein CY34DRAFT_807553 [Suillus luteus UH-Slu-Lm8-n1]